MHIKINYMSIKNSVCSNCEAEVHTDADFYVHDKKDNLLCEECHHLTFNDISTVHIYDHETCEVKRWMFNPTMGLPYNEYAEELWGGDEDMMPVVDINWVSTGGWCGYYRAELKHGFTPISEGWATGRWDDVPWKHVFNDLFDAVFEDDGVYPPCDVFCVTSPTSNVFSLNTTLLVRSEDEETFVDWLTNDFGLTREKLDISLQHIEDSSEKASIVEHKKSTNNNMKKQEKSTNNKKQNQQKPLNAYQKEMQSFKQVFESVGLPTSALETTETPRKQPDSTISVTFLNRSKSIKK